MLAFLSHQQALIFHDALTLKMQLIRKAVKMQHFINASHCAMLVTHRRVCHKDPISDSPGPHAWHRAVPTWASSSSTAPL